MDKELVLEKDYLNNTLNLVNKRLGELQLSSKKLEDVFDESNAEYFEYLKRNANKINEEDVVELVNMQDRLGDLERDSIDVVKLEKVYNKMLDKPYFASIVIKEGSSDDEKYYIGINSLVDDNKHFQVVDWRSPIASIFYDYEEGECKIKTNSSILKCNLLNKRQYGITAGHLDYYFDSTINIEDEILKSALASSASSHMKSIVQTIQREQNAIIRGDENKNLIVQGVAGSGKTAIALHRIAYLIYKMKGKITSKNFVFISPNNAFSSYISSVLPDLAEDDIEKLQLDLIARKYLKKHLILERKYEQVERLINEIDVDYAYKSSHQFLIDLINFANDNYINNFHLDSFSVRDIEIDVNKIHELFFGRYSDRDLFTRLKWITDNIFDIYFYKAKKPETIVKLKELIFKKLYATIENKNCVKAYMNFLKSKGLSLQLVGDKVKNEDAYGILFFKMFIFGVDKYSNIKHLVIDEMQDYTPLQMYILNQLFDCPKTILGDYNQTLDVINARNNLDDLSKIFNGDNEVIELNKSYRSTMEIADFFNCIGRKFDAKVVSRHGEKVDLITASNKTLVADITNLIASFREKGYNSIGIITKTNRLAKELHTLLSKKMDDINLIDDNIDGYDNKTCVISAFNSKGLEFDGAIVIDSDKVYKSEMDRNLMYIACTRPLHKLSVLSIENESKFIKEYKERKND